MRNLHSSVPILRRRGACRVWDHAAEADGEGEWRLAMIKPEPLHIGICPARLAEPPSVWPEPGSYLG